MKRKEKPKPDFWGLVEELSHLTSDDALIVAAVRNIFANQAVNPSLAPARVANGERSRRGKKGNAARGL